MHVFTLPAENWNELSIDKQVIRHLILKHRSFVDHLITLEDYYEGKHKILNDKNRENTMQRIFLILPVHTLSVTRLHIRHRQISQT